MRIGINAINFNPGNMGGVETYFLNLIYFLQKIDSNNKYVILCNKQYADNLPILNKFHEIILFDYGIPSTKHLIRGALKNIFSYDPLSNKIDGLSLDLVHHLFTVLDPIDLITPPLLTFWDMQQEFFPEYFTTWQLYIRNKIYRKSAELARRIIVSSNFTKECLMKHYGINEKKIDVIYTGFGLEYKEITDRSGLEMIKHKYSLDFPFLFYPAATWPHKNHRNLLLALNILIKSHGFPGKLVLTGMRVRGSSSLTNEIERLGLQRNVVSLGYVPSEELPYLYNLARLLVFPSLFEGFGIPLAESMACGCPVVCSNVTSIPEVVGDAGVLFDPSSAKDIAEKIIYVWENDSIREKMKNNGLMRAKYFSWEETARKTIDTYNRTII